MRIIFMGTSEFAVPAFKEIHYNSNYNIIAVVTPPDRQKGRGRKLSESPIKKIAVKLGYKVKQPHRVNDSDFIDVIVSLKPDLLVVIAFGQILCGRILRAALKGAINLHPSLIPKYRGPAPIQWAIINGDAETGVTTMFMNKEVDAGYVLSFKKIKILQNETYPCLLDRLAKIGSYLLIQTLDNIKNDCTNPIQQDPRCVTMAPLLEKKDGEINWNNYAKDIDCFIRGMNPWPGAFTFDNDKCIKIIKASVIELNFDELPGSILNSSHRILHIATGKNAISVEIIQTDSGKELSINAFLCGYRFNTGTVLGRLKKK